MKVMNSSQTWGLVVIVMLVGTSMALLVDLSSPGDGEVSPAPHPEQPVILRFLKALAERVFSVEGGGEDLHSWPKLELNWRVALAVVLGSLGASLCSAGGVGGGGLFIPLFNLLIGFDAKSAAALSSFMILGGALANVGWNRRQEHPFLDGQPVIDFDVASLLQPNMLLGISIGVICKVVLPSWFIILEFMVTLGYITKRSFRSGLLRWRNETRLLQEENEKSSIEAQEPRESLTKEKSSTFNVLTGCVLEESDVASPEVLRRLDSRKSRQSLVKRTSSLKHSGSEATEPLLDNPEERRDFPYVKLLMLTLVWLAFLAVQILRRGKSGSSILNLEPCGRAYWLLTIMQLPLALLLTAWSAWHLHHGPATNSSPEFQWDLIGQKAFVIFPSMALLAGFLGGMLGIGGGMIINPLLIEIGMHPQLTAATTAFMVFFSSSLSVVQFWFLGRLPLDFALLFAGICFVSSLIGLRVVQQAITRFGRPSVIVFSVSIVLGVSAVLTTIFGGLDVWKPHAAGEYMGFHNL